MFRHSGEDAPLFHPVFPKRAVHATLPVTGADPRDERKLSIPSHAIARAKDPYSHAIAGSRTLSYRPAERTKPARGSCQSSFAARARIPSTRSRPPANPREFRIAQVRHSPIEAACWAQSIVALLARLDAPRPHSVHPTTLHGLA